MLTKKYTDSWMVHKSTHESSQAVHMTRKYHVQCEHCNNPIHACAIVNGYIVDTLALYESQ